MDDERRVRISKYLSKYLRHAPGDIGLTLEPGGWVAFDALLVAAARHGFPVTREELDEVVATSEKQQFAFNEARTKIRANQGHSVSVEMDFEPAAQPDELYHGTAEANLPAVLRDGLLRLRRHHVHMSKDEATAAAVGRRHGKPVVLAVVAGKMAADGFAFFVSANGVWLVDNVPPEYLIALPRTA